MQQPLTLAIATIGDLLLKHRLTESDAGPVDAVELCIPEYQRPYKWTEANAIQLLDDIVDAKDANRERYRVGTLILHRKCESERTVYDIVDGQQRVITFALLLDAFGEASDFLDQPLADNPESRRNVPANYRALRRRADAFASKGEAMEAGEETLAERTSEASFQTSPEKRELLDYVKLNCEFIVVITDDLAEAFQFFDSQNARGKKLYPHDLLKAYHLREMRDLDPSEVEAVAADWEDLDQARLSALFSDYLYCVKRWVRGNPAYDFTERDIQMFKGVTQQNNYPYAQFFKGAYSFASAVNASPIPFVAGMQGLRPFQLDAPIIAGRPFFEYAHRYFAILDDIQDNDKYEGYFVNDSPIVKTIDARYRNGVGNRVARRLFDTALLLYVDRFCPDRPDKLDLQMFDEFLKLAFVWAYSLRAQYVNLGWWQAQNYVASDAVGRKSPKKNAFNMYKAIVESDSPRSLLGALSERLQILRPDDVLEGSKGKNSRARNGWNVDGQDDDGVYLDYLHFFKEFRFLEVADGR